MKSTVTLAPVYSTAAPIYIDIHHATQGHIIYGQHTRTHTQGHIYICIISRSISNVHCFIL